jgi:hypothetical protein
MNRTRWIAEVFRPLVVGVMVGCIALSLVEWVHLFVPDWSAAYFFIACVLAALEAHYSYRLIRDNLENSAEAWKFRAAELATFFLVLKIGTYLGEPWAEVVADIRTWSGDPLNILDMETMLAFTLTVLSWFASTQTARDLERLEEPSEFHRQERPPMRTLTARFFWGGTVLLIVSGMTRVGIAQLLNLRRPSVPGLILNVLVYFFLGLAMLGQVRFVVLRRTWQEQKIEIARDVPGRWVRYSLALVLLAALLAFLLPTGYTLGLLEVVGGIVGLILLIINILSLVVMLILSLPFLLFSLLFRDSTNAGPRFSPPTFAPPPSLARSAPLNWWEVLRSLVFWAVVVGVIVYVISRYVRDHPELWNALMSFGPFRALYALWVALWRRLNKWARAVRTRLPRRSERRRKRRGTASGARRSLFRPRSPRERILHYYWSALRRARKEGYPRRAPQTPNEYGKMLRPNLPEARNEVDALTQAFVEARYSQHTVEPDDAGHMRLVWQRVMEALQALTKKS